MIESNAPPSVSTSKSTRSDNDEMDFGLPSVPFADAEADEDKDDEVAKSTDEEERLRAE